MKNRLSLICVLIVFLGYNCFGQNKHHYKEYGLFVDHKCEIIYSTTSKANEISYVFADNVNMRSDSTQNGKIVETIKQGDEIEILGFTNHYAYKIRGHGEPWVKIKTKNGKTGYVYGALITKNYLKYDLNGNGIEELILLGNDFTNPPYGRLKIIENQKLLTNQTIDSICIDANCETLVMLRILKDKDLSNKEIIEIGTGANSCRPAWTSNYYYFDQNKLERILVETMGSKFSTRVLFPSDKGGVSDQILVKKKIKSLVSYKLIFEVEKKVSFAENELSTKITSNIKEDLVYLRLNIGDTIMTNQFSKNQRNNGLISPEDLNKILKDDNGIFKIAETNEILLLGDYLTEGDEVVEISIIFIRKLDFEILDAHRIAKETAWENGYLNMYSIYKGKLNFETVKLSGARDFGIWKRDTVRTHYNSN